MELEGFFSGAFLSETKQYSFFHNYDVFNVSGVDGQYHLGLRRMNTCTTYVSMRRKMNGSQKAVPRSGSFRNNDSSEPTYQQTHRHFLHLKSQPEEHI